MRLAPLVRLASGVALFALLLAPAAALAEKRGECRKITRQVDHFEEVEEMARARGNAMWEDGTRRHIEKLELRRARLCPQYAAELAKRNRVARMKQQTARLFRTAAKAAAAFFSGGLY